VGHHNDEPGRPLRRVRENELHRVSSAHRDSHAQSSWQPRPERLELVVRRFGGRRKLFFEGVLLRCFIGGGDPEATVKLDLRLERLEPDIRRENVKQFDFSTERPGENIGPGQGLRREIRPIEWDQNAVRHATLPGSSGR
jgi:hypothetical protein